jgi:hypothetical protein
LLQTTLRQPCPKLVERGLELAKLAKGLDRKTWAVATVIRLSAAASSAPVATPICKNRDFAETSRPVISKLNLTPTAAIYSLRGFCRSHRNGSFARSFSSYGRRTPCRNVQTRCSGVRAYDRFDRAGQSPGRVR